MTTRVWVRPVGGVLIRLERPLAGHMPEEGMQLELTHYYRRRIADGDLEEFTPPAPKRRAGKEETDR